MAYIVSKPSNNRHSIGLSYRSPSYKILQTVRNVSHGQLLRCRIEASANGDDVDDDDDAAGAGTSATDDASYDDLKAGSPIVIIAPPPYLKTAEPMPMMRANGGSVMPGDAGRIIGRKPKDVWAIRFASGAFLIDRKYFKPLDLD